MGSITLFFIMIYLHNLANSGKSFSLLVTAILLNESHTSVSRRKALFGPLFTSMASYKDTELLQLFED